MSIQSPSTRSTVADAAATLGLLVAGTWVLALSAPLVSAFAVILTLMTYVPLRMRAMNSRTPAG